MENEEPDWDWIDCNNCGEKWSVKYWDDCPFCEVYGPTHNEEVGAEENNGGHKADGDKVRLELLPWQSVVEVGKVYTFGAKKYADRNWEKGIKFSRLFAAIQRHLTSWWCREDNDPESGLSHLTHACFGVLCLLFFVLNADRYDKYDDRPSY